MRKTKKILSTFLAIAMMLCVLPMTLFADTQTTMPTTTVSIDLSTVSGTTSDYKVESSRILIYNRDVTYVLSGTTDKNIDLANNPEASTNDTYYIRLNNASIAGTIRQGNNKGWKVVIDVPQGTSNSVGSIILRKNTIIGSGTLTTKLINVSQDVEVASDGLLSITDTTVIMNPTSSVYWDGIITLGGNAKVTVNGNGTYSPILMGQQVESALTLNDNAKLYVLQDDMDEKSNYVVDGLSAFGGSSITLNDNSYLEAEGKNYTGDISYSGSAIMASAYDFSVGAYLMGPICINDKAVIKATSYGQAVFSGKITMNGGVLDVESKSCGAIYVDGGMDVTNGTVLLKGDPEYYILYNVSSDDAVAFKNSWVEIGSYDKYTSATGSVVFKGNAGTAYGNLTLSSDVKVSDKMTLDIPEGASISVPTGVTFTNNGTITLDGSFVNNGGTVICTNHTEKFDSNDDQYWTYCGICNHEIEKHDFPTVTINGKNDVCKTQDYTFNFTLPDGVTVIDYGYDFDGKGEDGLSLTLEDGVYSATISNSIYLDNDGFDLIVKLKNADGYEFRVKKSVNIKAEHEGGTANCKDQAECDICGESYGKLDPNNHTDIQHVDAKPATSDADGNIEYWYCSGCDKYFSDEELSNVIDRDDTFVGKLTDETDDMTSSDDTSADDTSANDTDNVTDDSSTDVTTDLDSTAETTGNDSETGDNKVPQTGDNAHIALWIALMFASCGVIAVVCVCGRKKQYSAK